MYSWDQFRAWPPPGGHVGVEEPEVKLASAPAMDLESVVVRMAEQLGNWPKVAAAASGVTLANIWRHPDASPAVLTLLLLDRYGEEYGEWDPSVLRTTLARDGIEMSGVSWTKILAARCALVSPSPWKQWEVFHYVCLGLSGTSPNFVYMEEPEIGHMLVGMDFMQLIDPEREPQEEIDKLVAAAFKHEAVPYIPPPLDFAQAELDERKLRCGDCGALHRDDDDARCITCGSAALKIVPGEYQDVRDAVQKLFDSRSRLPLEKAVADLPEDGVGNSVYKLLVHWDYLTDTRANTMSQLRMIGK